MMRGGLGSMPLEELRTEMRIYFPTSSSLSPCSSRRGKISPPGVWCGLRANGRLTDRLCRIQGRKKASIDFSSGTDRQVLLNTKEDPMRTSLGSHELYKARHPLHKAGGLSSLLVCNLSI